MVGVLLAAGGPDRFPARARWPLHRALKQLDEQAARIGSEHLFPPLTFRPCPDTGWRAHGADRGLLELRAHGVLRAVGVGAAAELTVVADELVPYKRKLLRLTPEESLLLQRAGTSWAAFSSTAAKNRSIAARSLGSVVASATPKRLQPAPASGSL